MCFKYLKKTLKMKVISILLIVHLGAIPLKRKLAISIKIKNELLDLIVHP